MSTKEESKKRRGGPTQPEGDRARKQRLMRLSDAELATLDRAVDKLGAKSRSDAIVWLATDYLCRR